jgi:nucleotide-binding universal stress UspA family protein
MKRFKNILVVFNNIVGDDDTLAQAISLAKTNGARLTVIEVVEDLSLPADFIVEKEKHLHRLTDSIQQDHLTVESVVLTGTPPVEIIRQVLRKNHDLVMVPAEEEVKYTTLFFGRTSLRLMRECPCAVWVTKPRLQNDYKRIMAAVGPNSDDFHEDELNTNIIDLATSLARMNNSELHIAHAWEVAGIDADSLHSEISKDMRDQIFNKHKLAHQEPLERFLERYDLQDIHHQLHLLYGDPAFMLPQLADTIEIDLIVMGTICRTGLPGFFIGNIAEGILHQVKCSVLTVKPEKFVSPVTLEPN